MAGWLPCQQTLSLTARFDADKVMRTKVMPRLSKKTPVLTIEPVDPRNVKVIGS